MKTLRVGLMGCGGRGREHALGYAQSQKARIVACSDPMEGMRKRLAKEFGIRRTYASYQEMLAKEKLDVVSVCLWTGMHHDAIMACIGAPHPPRLINAEKPMAPTFGEARDMHAACEQAGIMLTFSHQRRFGPSFARARELLKEGAIGELSRMEGFCHNLFDWGTHWFDMMFFYNDDTPAEWVMGQVDVAEERSVFGAFFETNGLSYIRWKNGVVGLLVTGDDVGGSLAYGNRLIGSQGIMEVREDLRLLRAGHEWENVPVPKLELPGGDTALYVLDSIDCLIEGRESILSSRKALAATELIFATYESSRRRARVHLPLEIEDSPLLSMIESGQIVVPDWPARLTAEEEAEGFRLLFSGADLDGWKKVGRTGGWRVEKGLLTFAGKAPGAVRTADALGDFVVRFECRLGATASCGIGLRTDAKAEAGLELRLTDDRGEPAASTSTGSLNGVVAPSENASPGAGRWMRCEVACRGSEVRMRLGRRDVLACDTAAVPKLAGSSQSGPIALRVLKGEAEFRNVRIKDMGK
jgi:UDP-N-acetylglucosamine 3-dehydrogenase